MAEKVDRQIGYRICHSSEILGDNLIIWGGGQEGVSNVYDHEDVEKRSFTTNLHLPTMEWSNVFTEGTPPAGAMDCSTTTIGEEMYVFGGSCSTSCDCLHNDLHQLNTNDKIWRSIPCSDRPMNRVDCGFISYSYQGSDYLLVLGGVGGKQPPTDPQLAHSLYSISAAAWHRTNEVNIMNITTSPGSWISPTVTGDRPPPLSHLTLNQLPNDRSKAVLFGGLIVPEADMMQCSNDIYTLSLTNDTVEFTKLSPQPHSLWPEPRYRHCSTIISNGTEDHLLVIGGWDDNVHTLADCWVLNITTMKWSQIDLPQSVCGRCYHSISSATMNTNTQWIIITGGWGMTGSFVEGVDVTMIVELECSSHGWLVGGVWNSTQRMELTERMKTLGRIEGMMQEMQLLRLQTEN